MKYLVLLMSRNVLFTFKDNRTSKKKFPGGRNDGNNPSSICRPVILYIS